MTPAKPSPKTPRTSASTPTAPAKSGSKSKRVTPDVGGDVGGSAGAGSAGAGSAGAGNAGAGSAGAGSAGAGNAGAGSSPETYPATRRERSALASGADATGGSAARDLADVSAVELVSTVAVHLLSAAALRCGLAEEGDDLKDLDEARTIINALAGLITAAAPDLGDTHARALRDGLRSVQLAFREASMVPDAPGDGPGEKYTGPVS